MSKQRDSLRSPFASKIAFDALNIEPAEDSDDETVEQQEQHQVESTPVQAKPSKSAVRKAKSLARLEKKQQQRAEAKKRREEELRRKSSSSPTLEKAEDESAINGSATTPSTPTVNVKHVDDSVQTEVSPEAVPEPVPERPADEENEHEPIPQKVETRGHVSVDNSIKEVEPKPLKAPETLEPPAEPSKSPKPGTSSDAAPKKQATADAEKQKKRQNALTRTIWTLIMIGGFIGLLLMGHVYMIILVMICQTLVYREVTALFSLATSDSGNNEEGNIRAKDPWSKTLNWYFFAVTNYFLYGESIIYYFKHVVFADAQLLPFATNHRIISFTLYVIGFMGFVMSLQKGYLKQQFGLFCWVHMTLLLIVVSSHFIMNNILEGLIWFWVPASLVICNDSFAYIWGITLGRTPLIKLSPKKTVEGFVGAFFSTVIFALFWGTYFMRFNYMICPVQDLGVSAWSAIQCKPNPVFIWRELPLWRPLAVFLSALFGRHISTISYAPYQLHLLFMSCFASLVAPFGGFFASGFKRAFNIKDFGHSIPGHGGMTDRMDCQFLMGVFTYVYYTSLIREHHVTVGSILQTIVSGLSTEEQLELIADLRRYLQKQGIAVPY